MDKPTPTPASTRVFAAAPARVGDGFAVHRALPLRGHDDPHALEPFLLLDHAGPTTYGPAATPRGVGAHPHRGFETVTLAYQGDLAHRDSAGNGGVLNPGDVQWMTAGRGVVHEEKHGPELSRHGGTLEMVQLWINVPKRHKREAPRYVDYRASEFPVLPLGAGGSNFVRLVAGRWGRYVGPAKPYTPLTIADLYLEAGAEFDVTLDAAWNSALYPLEGAADINRTRVASRFIATLTGADRVSVRAATDCHLLLLSGEPIGEPIAARGPFVMSTEDELTEAMAGFQRGEYGQL